MQIQPHELDEAAYEAFCLAQRLLVNYPKRQTNSDRQIGIDRLAALLTNRFEVELPLTPDGFSLGSRYAVYQEL